MLKYQKIETDLMVRSIAEAIDVLLTIPGFDYGRSARISIGRMPLPSGQVLGMPLVEYNGLLPEVVHCFWLATSANFRAIPKGSTELREYDVFLLDRATFDRDGWVKLADGTSLQAVEVQPAYLPLQPSELSWQIVHHVVALTGSQACCYRSLSDVIGHDCKDLKDLKDLKDERFLHCSTLSLIEPPSLKRIKAYIAKRHRNLKNLSTQTIADTLRQFGIRLPKPRPRSTGRQDSAAI